MPDIRNTLIKMVLRLNELTIDDLADLSGVSRESVVKWSNGERAPNWDHLAHLARIFQTDVFVLLGMATRFEINKVIGKIKWTDAMLNGIASAESGELQYVLKKADQRLIHRIAATHLRGVKLMGMNGCGELGKAAKAAEELLLSALDGTPNDRTKTIANWIRETWNDLEEVWPELWDPSDIHHRRLLKLQLKIEEHLGGPLTYRYSAY